MDTLVWVLAVMDGKAAAADDGIGMSQVLSRWLDVHFNTQQVDTVPGLLCVFFDVLLTFVNGVKCIFPLKQWSNNTISMDNDSILNCKHVMMDPLRSE